MQPKIIEFDGRKYRFGKTGYYHAENWGSGGPTTLHRAIWSKANGPIPHGHHIHHIDGNKANNEISNLDVISASEHSKHHADENPWVGSEANIRQIARAGEKAKEWHASPERLAWHSQHGKRTWEGRQRSLVPCQSPECKALFSTPYPTRAKYCCQSCKERARTLAENPAAPKRAPYKKRTI